MLLDEKWRDHSYTSSCGEHEYLYHVLSENFDLLVVPESVGFILWAPDICTRFNDHPSNICWDVSVWKKVVDWTTIVAISVSVLVGPWQ